MSTLPIIERRQRIFLSSTDDVGTREYRLAAKEIIENKEFNKKWIAVEMSGFVPNTQSSLEECKEKVLSCSVYVGLFGPFYGSIADSVNQSYTEFEYTTAFDTNREIGVFILPDTILNKTSPEILKKKGETLGRQENLKKLVQERHTTKTIGDLTSFRDNFADYLRGLSEHSPYPSEIFTETHNSDIEHLKHIWRWINFDNVYHYCDGTINGRIFLNVIGSFDIYFAYRNNLERRLYNERIESSLAEFDHALETCLGLTGELFAPRNPPFLTTDLHIDPEIISNILQEGISLERYKSIPEEYQKMVATAGLGWSKYNALLDLLHKLKILHLIAPLSAPPTT